MFFIRDKTMDDKSWDEIIENIILGYRKWWPQEIKSRVKELLLRALKERLKLGSFVKGGE
jgi:hypothetical protein